MPSRSHPQSIMQHISTTAPVAAPPTPSTNHQPLAAVSVTAAFSLLLLFTLCFRGRKKRTATVPSPPAQKPPHHFSYSSLRRATRGFSPSLRLGQGGFGSVYRATLPDHCHLQHQQQQNLAVKVMDSGSLQGEREFQNELLFSSKLESPYVVTALGFSYDRKNKSMLLVYELMQNGNLQDALLCRKCEELVLWETRVRVVLDVAKGIEYLHGLDPPVIHGDIKPSNVLLDHEFNAKVADFGLSWVKVDNLGDLDRTQIDEKANGGLEVKKDEVFERNLDGGGVEDSGSVVEETESVLTATTMTGFEEFSGNLGLDHDPFPGCMTSPETTPMEGVNASPRTGTEEVLLSPEVNHGGVGVVKSGTGKDWWWKQDSASQLGQNGSVKDYVMEWIGTEIKKERPKSDWIGASSSTNSQEVATVEKKYKKRLDWWISLDDDKDEKVLKKAKKRLPREWWKEEYCEELERKKKKREKKERKVAMKGIDNGSYNAGEDWWPRDEAVYVERKKKKKKKRSRSIGSRGSVDWLSHDPLSGEIPKSGGVSSTPSMRGTVCYVAPEYGGGILSEKSDVYSFGVLLLVIIAGRRPLQVITSPVSEFHRANLIHWARHLGRSGKLLDLVDKSIQNLDTEQAVVCITVALLCLQKSPSRRPSMREVVAMLTGEAEVPRLPTTEFSPSPPSRFPFKTKSQMRI